MIGDVTFYPNYFWYKGFTVGTYPSITGETFTSSGGETSGPLYDLVDARRGNIVTLDTNGESSSPRITMTMGSTAYSMDFFIVDNHNYDTAGSDLSFRDSGGSNLDLTEYWGGGLGEQLTSQSYNGAIKGVQRPDDGIFLGVLLTATSDDTWEINHYVSTSFGGDITIGEWFVGKKFTMSTAPEMPQEISNFDGVDLRVTMGGQKHGFGMYGERKAWRLSWDYVSESDKDDFLTVWRVTNGGRYPFYIDLGETANPTIYFVRFVDNSVRLEKLAAGAYKLSFLIESEV